MIADFLVEYFFTTLFGIFAFMIMLRFAGGVVGILPPMITRKPPVERRKAKLLKAIAKSEKKLAVAKQMREFGTGPATLVGAQRDIQHHTRMLTLYRAQLHELTSADEPSLPEKVAPYVSPPRESKEVSHARSLGKRHMITAWREWATSETETEKNARLLIKKQQEERDAERALADREARVLALMERDSVERESAEATIDEIDKKHAYMMKEQYRRTAHHQQRMYGLGGFTDYDEYAAYMRSGADIDSRSTSSERKAAREKAEARQLVDNPPVSDWTVEQLREWGIAALSYRDSIVAHYDINTWEKHLDYCCALITDKRTENFETKTGLTSTKVLRHDETAVRDAYIAGGIAGAEYIADAISRSRQLVRTDQQTAHAVDEVSRRMDAALAALKETHKPTEERADHEDWKRSFETIARPEITAGPETPKEVE